MRKPLEELFKPNQFQNRAEEKPAKKDTFWDLNEKCVVRYALTGIWSKSYSP